MSGGQADGRPYDAPTGSARGAASDDTEGLFAVGSGDLGEDREHPTLLLLHGFGAHEGDLAALADRVAPGWPWASLRAPVELAPGSHAWFRITTPGSPEPARVAPATDALWRWIDEHLGEESRVVPLGFSQGGLMATELLRARPRRVPAAVVLAGFVRGGSHRGDVELEVLRPALFWGRGDRDQVIAAHAVQRTASWLPGHTSPETHIYPGRPHAISAEEISDVREFLGRTVGA